jgi:hypothetical protein
VHQSSQLAQTVSHPSPTSALDLLALHAAEKPPSLRTPGDKANIVALLQTIEYFGRLPPFVQAGLADIVQLQRASKDEVLFTRIHGTKFMYVFSGTVVASSSIEGEEFDAVARQTARIRDRVMAERAKRERKVERAAARERMLAEQEEARRRAAMTPAEIAAEKEAERVAARNAAIAMRWERKALRDKAAAEVVAAAQAAASELASSSSIAAPAASGTSATAPAAAINDTTSAAAASASGGNGGGGRHSTHASRRGSVTTLANGQTGSGSPARRASVEASSTSSPLSSGPGGATAVTRRPKHLQALDAADSLLRPPAVRGFEIGFSNASIWAPNKRHMMQAALESESKNLASEVVANVGEIMVAASASPTTIATASLAFPNIAAGASLSSKQRQEFLLAKRAQEKLDSLSASPGHSAIGAQTQPPSQQKVVEPHWPPTSESVSHNGMVFHRMLPTGSLFGQCEVFENTYAGLDRVLRLKAYQMRLSRVLSNSTRRRTGTGWQKLKTLVHILCTCRDKAPLDSVVASEPCILLAFPHKGLEALLVRTKERTLNAIMDVLSAFRDLLFHGFSYKMLLALASVIEMKTFGPGTVLYDQGVIDKPVYDEKTRTLRPAKDVFAEKCEEANRAANEHNHARRRMGMALKEGAAAAGATANTNVGAASAINNWGHNPSNHSLYLLSDGMLQLEKQCSLQSFQRWPSSTHTWELRQSLVTRRFFAGFVRGKEVVGGEGLLGMEERDFRVSVPPGQTATCIVIRRAQFEMLCNQKRIQHAVHCAVRRLRELASNTIASRIQLRNHNVNHGVLQALRQAKAASTKKTGMQSVNEYLTWLMRSTTTKSAAAQAALITHVSDKKQDEEEKATREAALRDGGGGNGAQQQQQLQASQVQKPSAHVLGGNTNTTTLSSSLAGQGAPPKPSAAFAPTLELAVKPLIEEHGEERLISATATAGGSFGALFATPAIKPAFSRIDQLIQQGQQAEEAEWARKQRQLQQQQQQLLPQQSQQQQLLNPSVEGASASEAGDSSAVNASEPAPIILRLPSLGEEDASVEDASRGGSARATTSTDDAATAEIPGEEQSSTVALTVLMDDDSQPNIASPTSAAAPGSVGTPVAAGSAGGGANATAETSGAGTGSAAFMTPKKGLPSPSSVRFNSATAPATAPAALPTGLASPSSSLSSSPSPSPSPSSKTLAPITPSVRGSAAVHSSTLAKKHEHSRSISRAIQALPIRSGHAAALEAAANSAAAGPVPATTPVKAAGSFAVAGAKQAPATAPPAPRTLSGSKSASVLPTATTTTSAAPGVGLLSPQPSSLRKSPSASSLLPSILAPLAQNLPAVLATPVQPMHAHSTHSPSHSAAGSTPLLSPLLRTSKLFHRTDHARREAQSAQEDRAAARVRAELAAAQNASQAAQSAARAFQRAIQDKLRLYEQRLRFQQQAREMAYAARIADISRRLQAAVISSHHDNPFESASEAGSEQAALDASRIAVKIKQMLHEKTQKALAASDAAGSLRGALPPVQTVAQLTAEELQSLGVALPPAPLAIDDLSVVSKAIWDRHIRYLTDLEAEQRLVYAEYKKRKDELEAVLSEHEEFRTALLHKRYLAGATNLARDVGAAQEEMKKELAAKKTKADEEWAVQQEFDALNEEMIAMGAAGDEDGLFADEDGLMGGPGGGSRSLAERDQMLGINHNLSENAAYASSLLHSSAASASAATSAGGADGGAVAAVATVPGLGIALGNTAPVSLDAVSAMAAAVAAETAAAQQQQQQHGGGSAAGGGGNNSAFPVFVNPALQMGLEATDEPPLTDVMSIRTSKLRKEEYSETVRHTMDPLTGGIVALYFPPMPPAPDIRTRNALGAVATAAVSAAAKAAREGRSGGGGGEGGDGSNSGIGLVSLDRMSSLLRSSPGATAAAAAEAIAEEEEEVSEDDDDDEREKQNAEA